MASNTFRHKLSSLKKIIFALFYIDFRFMFVMFPQLCQNLCLCTIYFVNFGRFAAKIRKYIHFQNVDVRYFGFS